MNLETRYQYLSLLVKYYAQGLQNLKNRYKHLDLNDINFNCANITDEDVNPRAERRKSVKRDNE